MSQQNDNTQANASPPNTGDANEKLVQEAIEKYRELYSYSTDILLKELDRFNRADEKASKYATMFFFLIGLAAYFGKWIVDRIKWPGFPLSLPSGLPLLLIGLGTLIVSAVGLFLAHHAIKLRPVVSRPLNQEMLDFFERETRITIYYRLAQENSKAYEQNRRATDMKYTILKWLYYLMIVVFVFLAGLTALYCWYSWC